MYVIGSLAVIPDLQRANVRKRVVSGRLDLGAKTG